jgi:glycosyltransferase involved in cell wall biosynthesis
MRVAFYAPLKAPTHPHPSGDRRMARLLIRALAKAGHDVALASSFRSYDRDGDAAVQARLSAEGARISGQLLRRWLGVSKARRPQAWFTYHLYHKAPDHLGPAICDALRIPYVVAEPSVAPKRRGGAWASGYDDALAALGHADAALCLNSVDVEFVRPALRRGVRVVRLAPFLEAAPFARAAARRARHRARLARQLPGNEPWLLAVGMMRPGDKLESYRLLGRALARVADRPWRLLVVGDGAARAEAEAGLAMLGERVIHLGALPAARLPAFYAASDLYVWPAVREAYGMAILEAQASGLPVVAGRGVGVADIVVDGKTGLLVDSNDDAALARAIAALLDDPARRRRMGKAALARVAARHDIAAAARRIDLALQRARQRRRG